VVIFVAVLGASSAGDAQLREYLADLAAFLDGDGRDAAAADYKDFAHSSFSSFLYFYSFIMF